MTKAADWWWTSKARQDRAGHRRGHAMHLRSGFRLIALAIRHHVPVCRFRERQRSWRPWWPAACPRTRSDSAIPAGEVRTTAKLIESIRESPRTQVFYEAPHRLLETLADVVEVLGESRHVWSLAR